MSNDSHTVNRAPAIRINCLLHTPGILITDDEPDICFLISTILKLKDILTVFASTLSEADDIMKHSNKFSFIFPDSYLPDGRAVGHIKQNKKNCPLCKVVMITAHDNQADWEKASPDGADHFIGKPFSRELILSTIDKLSV